MRGLIWLIAVMLLLGGSGPMGSMIVASAGAAPLPSEDDDSVESSKPASPVAQERHHPRRGAGPQFWSHPLAAIRQPRDRHPPIVESNAFPAAASLRLTC